jgi:hypothetical protein
MGIEQLGLMPGMSYAGNVKTSGANGDIPEANRKECGDTRAGGGRLPSRRRLGEIEVEERTGTAWASRRRDRVGIGL